MNEDDLPPMEDAGPVDAPAIDETTETPEVTEAPQPRTVEDIASGMGWSPKEQWRGDPGKWKPADEFVASTAEINSKLANNVKRMEEQLSNINRTNAAMVERELAKQRQELLSERQEAFDTGDSERFNAVDSELKQLPTAPAVVAPEVQSFVEKHAAWFNKDQEATAWAVNRAQQLSDQGIGPARQLATVERELAALFPEYADKPKPKPVQLSQPGNRAATNRAKTFTDLPKEAQQAAEYWVKKGVTREQYVESYFNSQEA